MSIRTYKCRNERCGRTFAFDLQGSTKAPTCSGCRDPRPLKRIGPRQARFNKSGYQPLPEHQVKKSNSLLKKHGLLRVKEELK